MRVRSRVMKRDGDVDSIEEHNEEEIVEIGRRKRNREKLYNM